MKTSFVSSYATQTSMRLVVKKAQAEIQRLQKELITGRFQDIGVVLGGKTANALSLHRDFEQFNNIKSNNALVENRLSSTQAALSQSTKSAQNMLEALIIAKDGKSKMVRSVNKTKMINAFQAFTDSANLTSNGEYLFAGIKTDKKPLTNYFQPGNTAKAAFDNTFSSYFGFPQSSPLTSTITATQMQDFLDNILAPMFSGADWTTHWSSASDINITSRISREEFVQGSTNTNSDGFRNIAFAATISIEMMDIGLNDRAQSVLIKTATQYTGSGITGINNDSSMLGISQARLKEANTLLQVQADLTKKYVSQMEEVDVYTASTRVNTLMAQIESSYSITARLQKLNLINYLR